MTIRQPHRLLQGLFCRQFRMIVQDIRNERIAICFDDPDDRKQIPKGRPQQLPAQAGKVAAVFLEAEEDVICFKRFLPIDQQSDNALSADQKLNNENGGHRHHKYAEQRHEYGKHPRQATDQNRQQPCQA